MILVKRAESPSVDLRCWTDSQFGFWIQCGVPVSDLAGLVEAFDLRIVGSEQWWDSAECSSRCHRLCHYRFLSHLDLGRHRPLSSHSYSSCLPSSSFS